MDPSSALPPAGGLPWSPGQASVSSSVEWKACPQSLSPRAVCAGIVRVVCRSQTRSECEDDLEGVTLLPLGSTHVAEWHPETPGLVLSSWWGRGCGQPHCPGHCPPPPPELRPGGRAWLWSRPPTRPFLWKKRTCVPGCPGGQIGPSAQAVGGQAAVGPRHSGPGGSEFPVGGGM